MRRFNVAYLSILILVLTIPLSAIAQDKEISALASNLSASLAKTSKRVVAVVDFTDLQGNVTELGRYLAEELSVSLATSGGSFEVVDRTNLKVILQENKLASSGVIDPATARKLGQIAGTDVIISGTITPFGDSVRVSVKALDSATAHIIAAASIQIPMTDSIRVLFNRGAAGEQAPPALQVAQVPGNGPHSQPMLPPNPKAVQIVAEAGGIRAVATNCVVEGEALVCSLTLTSQNDIKLSVLVGRGGLVPGDRELTQAFDDSGTEYEADAGVFAGKTIEPNGQGRGNLLVAGVPTLLKVKFSRFNDSSGKLTLLKVIARDASNGAADNFELRDIPILRQ